jgi:hypothetical protein
MVTAVIYRVAGITHYVLPRTDAGLTLSSENG